jgi:ribosomal protein L37AE/L43A
VFGLRSHLLPTQSRHSVGGLATAGPRSEATERRSLLRRAIGGVFDRCAHEGLMTPLRTLRSGVEIWRCEQCAAEVVFVDDETWAERTRLAEERRAQP